MKQKLLLFFLLSIGASLAQAQETTRARVLFYDDFYDNSKEWAIKNDDEVKYQIQESFYIFQHKVATNLRYSYQSINKIDPERDYSIEASIKHLDGIQNKGYGLVFGRLDNNNQFEFMISANGYFRVRKYNRAQEEEKAPWTKTSHIRKGNYTINSLKVSREKGLMKYYVNSQLVYSHPAEIWPGKSVGFMVTGDQTVAIDYLAVRQKQFVDYTQYIAQRVEPELPKVNTAPEITIYEPQMSRGFKAVSQRTIKVAGKAADPDGIFEVKVHGRDAQLLSDGYFSLEVDLGVGQNIITIQATDLKMMSSTQTITLNRQGEPEVQQQVQTQQRRLALLIGNSDYQYAGALANPRNDVEAMAEALEGLGFTVLKYENCDQRMLKQAMDEFGDKLSNFDVGLFYYAGHGIQVDGTNYLVPVNAKLAGKNDVEYDCVAAQRILGKMEASQVKTNIVILDACRDNPFEQAWSRSAKGNGLAFMDAPMGSFIAYATSPGTVASDGAGRNSLYTAALLENIKTPGLTIEQLFQRVRRSVRENSDGKQIPWESTSLDGDFYFKR